jgi:hypothetical protein
VLYLQCPGVAWNTRVVASAIDPFDSPKKIVGWKIVDCVNRFAQWPIVTKSKPLADVSR